MAITTCKTNSIVLAPGEQFILPPGSTIIGATDVASITSLCLDLTELETLDCYVAILGVFNNSSNGPEYYEGDTGFIMGYNLNNSFTAFDVPVTNNGPLGGFDRIGITTKLKNAIKAIVAVTDGGTPHGASSINYVIIKTVPSVALNLQLVLQTAIPPDPTPNTKVNNYIPFIKLSDAVTLGYGSLPACPGVSLT